MYSSKEEERYWTQVVDSYSPRQTPPCVRMLGTLQALAELINIAVRYRTDFPTAANASRLVVDNTLTVEFSSSLSLLLAKPENQGLVPALLANIEFLDLMHVQVREVTQEYWNITVSGTPQAREAADQVTQEHISNWLNRLRDGAKVLPQPV